MVFCGFRLCDDHQYQQQQPQPEFPLPTRTIMSIVQGYTSSEDESDLQEEEEQQHTIIEPPTKKIKTFSGEFQSLPITNLHDDETIKSRKISKDAKKLAKQLKNKRYKNGKSDPWSHHSSSNEEDDDQQPLIKEQQQEVVVEVEEKEESSSSDPLFEPSSEYVGSEEFDYQGRTYMNIPKYLSIDLTLPSGTNNECFVPKKIIHKFPGHSKGVNKLQFFPNSGHLLLSCGNDGLIKLWSIYGRSKDDNEDDDKKYELLRIFKGHTMAVKDIKFNSKGDKFLSCGYDKRIHLWDTKTGNVLKTINVKAIPNVLLFNPKNEDEFIVGLNNFKIEHYKFSSIQYRIPIQIYDHHQGGIIDLVNLKNSNLFISSSDDKTVRFWKWQINIPEKVITDPSQHSLPSIQPHPMARYIALQSMDNSVKVIHLYDKFKWYKKKVFRGHQVAGYGIEIGFSPDGKIIMSGDSKGLAYFWDWKTCKLVKKLKLCDKPVKCIVFHPQESSKVAVAGSSGEIYYCD